MACFEYSPYYYLYFNSMTVVTSSRMIEYKSSWTRLTEIQKRQNYWGNQVILDGRYPAIYLEHEFTVYTEGDDRYHYASRFYDVPRSIVTAARKPLAICHPDFLGQPVVTFGDCYIESSSQENPADLLMFSAGIMRLRFLGTEIPSVGGSLVS